MNQFPFGTVLASLLFAAEASGQTSIRDCDAPLILATYNKVDRDWSDWRMADAVDEQSYNRVKTDAGANAVIYGVPAGATFGQFKENVRTLKRDRTESYSVDKFRSVAWTGLDPNGARAYGDCLRTVAQLSRKGLVLAPVAATASDVSFVVTYTPIGKSPNPLPVQWRGAGADAASLPRRLVAGDETIIVKRPRTERTLAVIGPGITDSVVLAPLPQPLPPEARTASRCMITDTPEPRSPIRNGGSATWLCPPLQAGKYHVVADLRPTADTPRPLRVHYTYELQTLGKDSQRIPLSRSAGENMDINKDERISLRMTSSGDVVQLPEGPVLIRLRIGGVYDHDRFSNNPRADDGGIIMPKNVHLELKRVAE